MRRDSGFSPVIITGTTRGLGFHLCLQLLREGHFVTGFARSGAPLEFLEYIDNNQYRHIVADLADIVNVELVYSEFLNRGARSVFLNAADYSIYPAKNHDSILRQLNL